MRDKMATSPDHSTSQIDDDEVLRAKNEAAIEPLHEWLADDSGYSERAWPHRKRPLKKIGFPTAGGPAVNCSDRSCPRLRALQARGCPACSGGHLHCVVRSCVSPGP
jgi:hypothetical protein